MRASLFFQDEAHLFKEITLERPYHQPQILSLSDACLLNSFNDPQLFSTFL